MAQMVKRTPITPGDLTDHQWGTDDTLTGDDTNKIWFGDAGGSMFDFSKGGNDTFYGFSTPEFVAQNTFYGDAGGNMSDHSKGGDDAFIGGAFSSNSVFYGDASGNMSDHSEGGNDTLLGGFFGSNTFYGDAGGNMSDCSGRRRQLLRV